MLLSPGLMLLTNYIAACWPDIKPIKFWCIGSDVVKPIIMWQMLLSLGLMLLTNYNIFVGLVLSQYVLCWSWCYWPFGYQGVTSQMVWLCLLMVNVYYFNCISGDLTSTLSQICGSWYLPIFLLRDGSLTLISIASLIVLVMLWSSLPQCWNYLVTLHDQWS